MMAQSNCSMSFPENSSRNLCLETGGTGFEEGSEGAGISMLGAAGVAGADFPTGGKAAMSVGSI